MKDYQHREPEISEREIERQYAKVVIELAEPNRVNCYRCAKGHIVKTIDIHKGVTPMFLTCYCGLQSSSTFYNDIAPDIKPSKQWFVPTLQEIKKYKRNPDMLRHIFMGGLELRTIK